MAARSAAFSSPAMLPRHVSALASARMIWATRRESVPLKTGGAAEGIASSSGGTLPNDLADLHCVFAKEVTLKAVPSIATLHLFAFTRYRLYVNGNYSGRGPGRFQNQRPEYDSRDISMYLHPGRNTLVVLVHRDAPTGRIMRHDAGFIAALEMTHGAEKQVIATDASWLSMPERSFGPRAQAWSSIEEQIDARKSFDWILPDLSLAAWQPSVMVPGSEGVSLYPRRSPLQQEKERPWSAGAQAFPIALSAGSEIELNLPEIAQAFTLLEMDAEEGSLLEITYGLPEGQPSGRCTYISRAGAQTYMGGDTFAFRRLRLRLKSGSIQLKRAVAWEVRYPFERAASFACSDPFLTRLWGICARSLEVLSEDAYVDCADRERVEWTDNCPPAFDCTRVMMRGPGNSPAAAGAAHWGDGRLLRDLLSRIALTQQPDGQIKAHSCSERFDIHAIMEDRSCDWVVQLREYAESSGDLELVRELWPVLIRLLGWYRKRRTARGLVLAREWEVWDNALRYQVCEGAGLNAMVYRALADASVLAESIGRVHDAESLAQEAKDLRTDYNRLLWNEQEGAYDGALFGPGSEMRSQFGHDFTGPIVDGRYRPTAQGNLFALYGGVVPHERVSSVRRWILNHFDEVRGPMSHYYLFHTMYAMEAEQMDIEILKLMRAGWTNQVESEWQTTWEDLGIGGGSKIHSYGMHPGYFLTAFVLGARRVGTVGQRTILIEPRFSGLQWARGVCVTEFGPVEMEWKINADNRPEIVCTIPRNVHCKLRVRARQANDGLEVDGETVLVRLADGWLEAPLQSGQHTIRIRL